MPARKLLQESKRFEIEAYKKPRDLKELRKTHVPFSGSPSIHPYDPKRVILVPDPYSTSPFYYEFKSEDIAFIEKLPSIVSLNGGAFKMARLWIKKTSVGLVCTPFLVEETGKG
jgi:hypothetical protein